MIDTELYEAPTREERAKMAAAIRRLDAAAAEKRSVAKTSTRRTSSKRPTKSRRKRASKPAASVPADDTTAVVELDNADWRAFVLALPVTLLSPHAPAARASIVAACKGKTGSVQVWGSADGFCALLSELLRDRIPNEPHGHAEGCRVAASIAAQVSRTMKWS